MNPQQIQQALEARAGRPLTPDEINQAKAALPGWDSGQVTQDQLAPLFQYIDQNIAPHASAQQDNPNGPGYQASPANPAGYTGYTANGPWTDDNGGPGGTLTNPSAGAGAGAGAGSGTTTGPAPSFNAPTFTAPTFNAPGYTPPPAFKFDDFKAPSVDEALNDPGYQFRLQQGQNSLQNWAAARGTLNDSGTAKSLIDYGQNAGSQEYQNVYNRDFNTWNANLGNAMNTYATNYGSQYLDPYSIQFQGANAAFAPQMAGFQANVGSGMAGFGANVNSQMAGYGNQNAFDMAGFNANVNSALTGFNANVNNQALQYQTQAQAGQHQNDMNYLNAWNQFLNSQNYFSNWQDRTFNKTLQTATA